jgi:energy-coupling factor transport system substrate-specific component
MSNQAKLNLNEIIFIAILASALGVIWWAYSLIYDLISPLLRSIALSGLLEGVWQLGGILFIYIIRKPGSAILGELIASIVEGIISQWGISALASAICQGLPVELVFYLCRYRVWNNFSCGIAGAMAAIGGYLVTYYWYSYNMFSWKFNFINLSCNIVSGVVLGGLLARLIARRLLATGVLNQFAISKDN